MHLVLLLKRSAFRLGQIISQLGRGGIFRKDRREKEEYEELDHYQTC